jgi:polysaccharide biosynthesis/export protein ExoF
MFRHRVTNSRADTDDRYNAPPIGKRGRGHAVWLSFAFFVLLACGAVGASMQIPPAQLAGSLQALTDAWSRLTRDASATLSRPFTGWRSEAPHRVATSPTMSHITDVPVISAAEDRTVLAYGDRLKITFFETLDVQLDSGTHSDPAVAAVFPRMDLSGDYAVDESGSVNIPRLGQIAAAGQTITGLQREVLASFKRVIGRTSDVHVAIVERLPVYVLGMVRNSGSFPYMPGMVVLHALADAGGIGSGTTDTSSAIESIRETERLHAAEDQMDQLLIKHAALIAERDNAQEIEVPPSIQLRELQAKSDDERKMLMARVAAAAVTLSLNRRRHQEQFVLAQRQLNITQAELDAQHRRGEQLKDLLEKKQTMLHELQAIAAHGSVPKYRIMDMTTDISAVMARQDDVQVAIVQAERGVAEAAFALEKLQTDYASRLDDELIATQHEIDDCAHSTASMRAVVQVLRNSGGSVPAGAAKYSGLRIMRRVAEGLTVVPATETTSLLPGDILQVESATHPVSATSEGNAPANYNGG